MEKLKLIKAILMAYVFNLLIALDTFANAGFGGDAGETISSRLGKGKLARKPVHTFLSRVVDLLFQILFGQQDHCVKAIQVDEGKNAVSEVIDRFRRGEKTLFSP